MDEIEKLIKNYQKSDKASEKMEIIKQLGSLDDARSVAYLIETLDNAEIYLKAVAAEALGKIGDVHAVGSLVKILYYSQERKIQHDETRDPWIIIVTMTETIRALWSILKKCDSVEDISEFENAVTHATSSLRKGHISGDIQEMDIKIADVLINTIKKKNSLASNRDLLLDDIPKPSKKGRMFRTLNPRLETQNPRHGTISGSARRVMRNG